MSVDNKEYLSHHVETEELFTVTQLLNYYCNDCYSIFSYHSFPLTSTTITYFCTFIKTKLVCFGLNVAKLEN